MNHAAHTRTTTAGHPEAASVRGRGVRGLRWAAAGVAIAVLTACGGGAYLDSAGNFNIGVTVGGQYVGDTPVPAGGSLNVTVRSGQSATFDAGESAVWTMYVGGAAITGGAHVYYAGADISATTLSRSRVAVDTYSTYRLQAPVAVTLVATSTYDSAQVATINLLITN